MNLSKRKAIFLLGLVLSCALIFNACTKEENPEPEVPAPTISSFTPDNGLAGDEVTINGTNFSTTKEENVVKFSGNEATVKSASATKLTVIVPDNAATGKITVMVNKQTATSENTFTILHSPEITGFSPDSAMVGEEITISGNNFGETEGANTVKINGIEATVTSFSATTLKVTVPEGATSGAITVTVNGLTPSSAEELTVVYPPVISSFAPESGEVGMKVTITGENFGKVTENIKVRFNGAGATITAATSTELVVVVPHSATSGKISVDVSGQEVMSEKDFEVIVPFEALKAGGAEHDLAYSSAMDAEGNIYITGVFKGTAQFGDKSLTSLGESDIFIAKYDPQGNIIWATRAGGTSFESSRSIAVDSEGNSYITGDFRNTSIFGSTTLTASGFAEIFVAKFDADGEPVWAKQVEGTDNNFATGIDLDALGDVYITGTFGSSAKFGTTTLTSPDHFYDIFIAKYSSSGAFRWAKQYGGEGMEYAQSISLDGDGNIFVTGAFYETMYIGDTTMVSAGGVDMYLSKFDVNGNHVWSVSGGGASDASGFTDIGYSVTTDALGNALVAGMFFSDASFGKYDLSASGTESDIFVAEYSKDGKINWIKSAGGAGKDAAYDVAINETTGNIYVTGEFIGSATFGGTGISSTYGSINTFLWVLDQDGLMETVKYAGGGSNTTTRGVSLEILPNDDVYMIGNFYGNTSLWNTDLTSSGSDDMFIWNVNP